VEGLTHRLYHTAPRTVAWRTEPLGRPAAGSVSVRTTLSALSGGTEGLFFRGDVDEGTDLDPHLQGLSGKACYPFRYGYCLCGVVNALGAGVAPEWLHRRVFAFEPHCSSFHAPISTLHPIPDELDDRRAVFFPLAETAATLVLDASPRWKEKAVVFGLGPLGALTAGLLSDFPLESLDLRDQLPGRQLRVRNWIGGEDSGASSDFDLAFDLGGTPGSLAAAVKALGFGGRLILGSWQGRDLLIPGAGAEFHRKRLETITSQVSTLAPGMTARWTMERRTKQVWDTLRHWPVEQLISHELPHDQAQTAFENLQQKKDDVFQVVLTYE